MKLKILTLKYLQNLTSVPSIGPNFDLEYGINQFSYTIFKRKHSPDILNGNYWLCDVCLIWW